MDVEELLKRGENNDNTDSEWLKLEEDIGTYLSETDEKEWDRRIAPLGLGEQVFMICDGIRRRLKKEAERKQNG